MKPLMMTHSGTRGIIGENLPPEIAVKIAKAFGAYLGKGPVVVGGDTRTSHDMLKWAVLSGLTAVGTDVIDIGKVPTPTVQQMIRRHKAAGGVVITASHNPIIWNGIKLMPTFHPAFLLRSPDKKREVWEDMKKVRDYLKLK